ncbi:MAG TPA: hypothetical protein VGF39_15810 [Stellaceae bacterium]|jgi:hypothetical protein
MGTPAKAPPPQPDPMLDQLMQTAGRQQQVAMQSEAAGDTASLMARYGVRQMLGGTSGAPFGRGSPLMAGFGKA